MSEAAEQGRLIEEEHAATISVMEQEGARARSELESLKQASSGDANKMSEVQAKMVELESKFAASQEELDKSEQEHAAVVSALEGELASACTKLRESNDNKERVYGELSRMREACAGAACAVESELERRVSCEADLVAEWERSRAEMQGQLNGLEDTKRELGDQVQTLQAQMDQAEASRRDLVAELQLMGGGHSGDRLFAETAYAGGDSM